ncbi:MAG: chromate efflux transporter [Gammaproteobacteria bacterium]
MPEVPFGEALVYWLKLGFISFGGPAGQISMMHQELVEKRRWISERRFLHALNYCMVLPGPEAQQLATYIGWLMHGVRGGIAAGVLFVLPSLIILIGLTWGYLVFHDIPAVSGVLYGIKPAVTAIVVYAACRIGSRALNNTLLKAIAILAFVAIYTVNIPFPVIVISAGLLGFAGVHFAPEKFNLNADNAEQEVKADKAMAIIGDTTPMPEHVRLNWRSMLKIVIAGLSIWCLVFGWLAVHYGWDGVLTQMSRFFTKAAFLTFGGAYAVLPYVYQGGVTENGWLSGTQMLDGLALGETTPGPLIMIVAFVGFVGGWTQEIFGPDQLAWAGIAGASVATLFTFLPSFIFILLGGPSVEATRHEIRFTGPLQGITAAVVGVVLNLAVFFAVHVLWPEGLNSRFDGFAAILGLAAFFALFKYKAGVVPVIGLSAIAGFLSSFMN